MRKELIEFLKHPVYREDENRDFQYRLAVFWRFLLFALLFSFLFGIINSTLEPLFGLELGKHAIDDFMDQYSPWWLLGAAVIVAPVVEELLFRGPMVFFRNSVFFGYVFYVLTLFFGFYHITNFEISTSVLLLSPLLVAPQLCVGLFLGVIRVKFGLSWAIALHALYNLILIGPIVLLQIFDIAPE
ncbi:CPBP family intramembrane metalloprotease [Flavobacteriaceae bacterium TP-CH-4]|uniref:CPBP family intramembrane metalloprotease n=1 Tax=Pelagihabitans pacificus TaxID=2696054 RepID=A0A967AUG4_9FLAO|nr:CPBP family intramembrane glutamic endopeptidase [Pelagihabitans pacificus]NHF60219.1 CPBP family intramembrane metalloprotease [Pelagihabitans pacificus]